jgi:hypothetical protein
MIQTATGEFILAGWTQFYGFGGLGAWFVKIEDSAATITAIKGNK